MGGGRVFVAGMALCVCLTACSEQSTRYSQPEAPSSSPTAPLRSDQKLPKIEFNNAKRLVEPIERAISDIKRIGLWDPLTKHLYLVKFAVYERGTSEYNKNHLANA